MNENNPYYTLIDAPENFVVIEINPIDATIEQFDDYILSLTRSFNSKELFIIVQNVSEGKFLSSEQRIKISRAIKNNEEILKKNCLGFTFVNKSLIAAVMLKVILKTSPPPVPYKVFKTLEEAYQWGNEALRNHKS